MFYPPLLTISDLRANMRVYIHCDYAILWSSDVIHQTKTHLSDQPKKAQEHRMTMVLSEGNSSSQEAIVRENKPEQTSTFIGPMDASNEAWHLHEQQSRNLAMVAVMNIGAYGQEYRKVFNSVHNSVNGGILRFGKNYPNMTVDQQIDSFISHTMSSEYKSHDEVAVNLKSEKENLRVGTFGPDQELQLELNTMRDLVKKQATRILAVREKLVLRGASDDFMREFDYTTKLMTKPDQEAYELEKELTPEAEGAPLIDTNEITLFDKFKYVLSASFGRKALRSIGILSPKSGEVTVIRQDQEATQ